MRTMKRTLALLALTAVLLMAAPALAGPQNGEVNHYGKGTGHSPCAGSLPDLPWWEQVLDNPVVSYVMELLPLDVLFPDADDLGS